jgi:hypothetical protein
MEKGNPVNCKKMNLLFNLIIFQVRKFESINHNCKGRCSFIQIHLDRTGINRKYSIAFTIIKLFMIQLQSILKRGEQMNVIALFQANINTSSFNYFCSALNRIKLLFKLLVGYRNHLLFYGLFCCSRKCFYRNNKRVSFAIHNFSIYIRIKYFLFYMPSIRNDKGIIVFSTGEFCLTKNIQRGQ